MATQPNSKILLVDDDPLQVRVRELVLREADFEVVVATSAEAALALLRANSASSKVNAIITDHLLPGASGAEFVRDVRRANPTVPIVVLTGMISAEEEYAGLGVTFLVKPVPPDDLIHNLRALVAATASC